MPLHVVHAAVVTGVEPLLQVGLMLGQLDVGDAQLLEAQLRGPLPDLFRDGGLFLWRELLGQWEAENGRLGCTILPEARGEIA